MQLHHLDPICLRDAARFSRFGDKNWRAMNAIGATLFSAHYQQHRKKWLAIRTQMAMAYLWTYMKSKDIYS
jgi:hypothetical protein